MIGSGLIVSLIDGSGEKITKAITDSTSSTVTFVISLVGIMCLWCGIMKIAEESGLTNKISKILKPILKILFKEKNNEKVMGPVVMNLTANILGLGNAATPMGIKAMKTMQKENKNKDTLSNSMMMFIVLNTASLQLIPTNVIAIRSSLNSSNPTSIIIPVWIATVIAGIIGIICTKFLIKKVK